MDDTPSPTGSRRTFLKLASVAVGSGLASRSVASGSTADGYDRVVDVVEAGADPTGEEPIDDIVHNEATDGTLLEFPDGRYRVDQLELTWLTNVGLRATGDATLVPGGGCDVVYWIAVGNATDFLFEGFTLDHTATGCAPTVVFRAHDGLVVRDVTKRGYHDTDNTAFGFEIQTADGTGLVERLRLPDGSIPVHPVGVYAKGDGTLTFRDCQVERFGNNGLYASVLNGVIQVEGGLYRNNDRSNVRLGSAGSYVRGARIVVDDAREEDQNLRGVRFSDGPGPVTVEDCEIQMLDGKGFGGIVNAYNGGSLTVRNTHVAVANEYRNQADTATGYAILVDEPSQAEQGSRLFEGVRITGDAWSGPAVSIRRGDTTFRNCCLDQMRERDGIGFQNTPQNILVEDSVVDVPGEAFVGEADLTTRNVSYDGGCQQPVVSTDAATDVVGDAATLQGTLSDLGGASSVAVHFEWGESGGSLSNATAAQTLSATGGFSETVTGLTGGTTYEYRVVAAASDGGTATGGTRSFTTTTANAAPAVDVYHVSEARSPNPHAEIRADWDVSDADGNLERIEVVVTDSQGTRVGESSHTVSGGSASGTDSFKVKHAGGQTFDVTLRVRDAAGAVTTAVETVSS